MRVIWQIWLLKSASLEQQALLLGQIVQTIEEISEVSLQAWIYTKELLPAIARHDRAPLLERALQIIDSIPDASDRFDMLLSYAELLSSDQKSSIVEQALQTSLLIESQRDRGNAIDALLLHLSETQLLDLWHNLDRWLGPFERKSILLSLCDRLPAERRDACQRRAYVACLAIEDKQLRLISLGQLLCHTPIDLQPEIIAQVLDLVAALEDSYAAVSYLVTVAQYAEDEQRSLIVAQAYKRIEEIDDHSRSKNLPQVKIGVALSFLPELVCEIWV